MRIGILCYPTSGGSGVVASELGMALAARGHFVDLFSYKTPFRLRPASERFRWREIAIPRYPLFEHPSYDTAAASAVAGVELDLLHVHYAYPHAVSAYLAREMSGGRLRTVTTLHGTEIRLLRHDEAFAHAVRFGLERSDAVTAVSRFLRDKTLAWCDPGRPVEVIPDFVNAARFPAAGLQEPAIVHVSNFRSVKRSADAVQAFGLVRRRREAKLVLVGTGPELDEVRGLAARLGVDGDVEFAGEEPEVARHLRRARVLLSTSEYEGFGLSVLEAMACGVPVVTTDSGGVREVVTEACALTAGIGDVEALAAGCLRLLEDAALARAMGEAGRRRAVEQFEASVIVPRYEALYERVLGTRHAEDLSV
jgi:N-acetyl-alpha-D-glucosaminyl L-malate synthase BshA